jgi:hypothetical protein
MLKPDHLRRLSKHSRLLDAQFGAGRSMAQVERGGISVVLVTPGGSGFAVPSADAWK